MLPIFKLLVIKTIDTHRLKIQGGGDLKFLPKSLRGSSFSGKIDRGVDLFWDSYCIFTNKFFENLPGGGGCCFISPLPLLCASMIKIKKATL